MFDLLSRGYEVLSQGGVVMLPLLFFSIVAITIIIDRFFAFRHIDIDAGAFMTTIRKRLAENKADEAIAICEKNPAPLAKIILAGLRERNSDKETLKESIDLAGLVELPGIERYLNVLSIIAKASTLLGLLGTVLGMIRSFDVIASSGLTGDPGAVAAGIATALITTATGLTIAIPALIFYHHFSHRAQRVIIHMERSAMELIGLITRGEIGGGEIYP